MKAATNLDELPNDAILPRGRSPVELKKDTAAQIKRAESEAQFRKAEAERNNKPVKGSSRNLFAQADRRREHQRMLAEKEKNLQANLLAIMNDLLVEIKSLRTELGKQELI